MGEVFKLSLAGSSGSGKTCFARKFVINEFDRNQKKSIGVDFFQAMYTMPLDQSTLSFILAWKRTHFLPKDVLKIVLRYLRERRKLHFWDSTGQIRYGCWPLKPWEKSDCILLMFSINNHESFEELSARWMKHEISENARAKTPVVLIGNKADLKKEVNREEIDDFCQRYDVAEYVETSCKTGKNIRHAVDAAVHLIIQMGEKKNAPEREEIVKQETNFSFGSKNCIFC